MEAVSLETISETCVSNSNECQLNLERSDRQMSKPRKRKRKPRKKEKELKSNDSQINNAASFEERKEGETEKTTSEDQVQLPKNCLSTREDSQPGGINTTCSERKRQRKKRKKDKNRNVLREGGVDTNSEVTTKCDARHVSKAEGSQFKSTDEKNVASDVINGCLKSKDDSVEQQMGADLKANDTVSQTQNPKAKKKKRRKSKTMEVCDALGTTLATSTKSKSVESMKIAGVSEVRSKKRKRKKKKTSSTDQKSADMEVCDPSGNTLPATIESGSVECSLDHSNKQILGNCDRSAGPEFLGEDRTSKTEKSATGELCGVHNPGTRQEKAKDEIGGSKQKRKRNKSKKKKKSCEDHKTDNMDEKKDGVSVPRNEEVEFDGEKFKSSLSSSVLIHDNVAHGVASQETGDLPRCSCKSQSTRKLVVFDLNGILADVVQGDTGEFVPDGKISSRSVFRRPFVASFLDFCFERFDVGIWSSRRIGLDYMINLVMGNHARNLLFCFDQSICITTNFKTLEKSTKPLFLKDLRRVWNHFEACLSCGKRKYDETNTLLVDDSPDKALCNPPHTGIFPLPYQYTDREDSALGPDGELRKYMEQLVDAEKVQKLVEENPIGQTPITETHKSWNFYSRVINAHKHE